jgi:glycosyltransferase involved in cell wall biosynthesis
MRAWQRPKRRGVTAESTQTSQTTQPTVVAGIIAYDEEQSIAGVVRKAKKFVDEVVVVDDGSRDATSETAKAAGAMVINHGVNKGYGEGIKSCLEMARLKPVDVLVILDGDGQHDPDDIPRLLAPILCGEADVVVGSRFLSDKSDMPRYRKFGINVITFLYNFGSGAKVTDAQSGFRAYSRRALDGLAITQSGMGASVEVIIKMREKGFTITEAPIRCIYHSASHSANPVTHGLSVALTVLKLRFKVFLRRLIGKSRAGNESLSD